MAYCVICGASDLNYFVASYVREQSNGSHSIAKLFYYNTDVINDRDLEWIHFFYVLRNESSDRGTGTQAHMTGPGYLKYSLNGAQWREIDGNTNTSSMFDLGAPYFEGGKEEDHDNRYLLHRECWRLLARAVIGDDDVARIDNNVLFDIFTNTLAMRNITHILRTQLFWAPTNHDNRWQMAARQGGEEFLVCDPSKSYGSDTHLLEIEIRNRALLRRENQPVELQHRVRNDPFANLNIDTLYLILQHLSGFDLSCLLQASWFCLARTRDKSFWLRRIHRDMPWFWELRDLIREGDLANLNLKNIYLWADTITTPKQWLTGPYMSLANRRRVWVACALLAEAYKSRQAERLALDIENLNVIDSAQLWQT